MHENNTKRCKTFVIISLIGDNEYRHISELVSKLTLFVNPNEDDHALLLEKVRNMEVALSSGGSIKTDLEFWNAHKEIVAK